MGEHRVDQLVRIPLLAQDRRAVLRMLVERRVDLVVEVVEQRGRAPELLVLAVEARVCSRRRPRPRARGGGAPRSSCSASASPTLAHGSAAWRSTIAAAVGPPGESEDRRRVRNVVVADLRGDGGTCGRTADDAVDRERRRLVARRPCDRGREGRPGQARPEWRRGRCRPRGLQRALFRARVRRRGVLHPRWSRLLLAVRGPAPVSRRPGCRARPDHA